MSKIINRFKEDLQLAGYAKRSIESYTSSVLRLQRFYNKPLEDITEEDLRQYWLCCQSDFGWSAATLRISYSGIQHFFTRTLVRSWKIFSEIKWRREEKLPTILSLQEVKKIIDALPTQQSHTFYLTLYSLGLRLREATTLQVRDILSDRKLVHIHGGKGAMDRMVPLPNITLSALREYYITHRNPKWIFPALGHNNGKDAQSSQDHVSDSGVQGALRSTLKRLNFKKHVHPHVFRHAYADKIGCLAVLHTWGSMLQYHPHIHMVIPGGAVSRDGDQWLSSRQDMFVHTKPFAVIFRAKFRDEMEKAGLFHLIEPSVWKKEWVANSQYTGKGENTLRYLSRYVFRVAISNNRIKRITDNGIRFSYKDRERKTWKTMELKPMEFIRRFLQHVLPHGFMKIRHYGFMHPNSSLSVDRLRELISLVHTFIEEVCHVLPEFERPKIKCACCGKPMRSVAFLKPVSRCGPE